MFARKEDADFFCEYSGHIGFKEFYYIDDALYCFLKLLKVFEKNSVDFKRIREEFPKVYIERFNVECPNPHETVEEIKKKVEILNPKEIIEIDGVDLRFEKGRILIRPSNTEPLIRVLIEAEDKETFRELKEKALKLL